MKHARADYNRIQDPAGLIPEDEPVFLIRAQDAIAPMILRHYAVEAHRVGASRELCEATLNQANEMERWQRERSARKTPDMPAPVERPKLIFRHIEIKEIALKDGTLTPEQILFVLERIRNRVVFSCTDVELAFRHAGVDDKLCYRAADNLLIKLKRQGMIYFDRGPIKMWRWIESGQKAA